MAETRYGPTWDARSSYKSWGEEQIARLLEREGIAYQYEHPLAVQDRGKTRIYYPDFRLPEYGLIIEYFGVNGDPGYDARTRHKMQVYKQAGKEHGRKGSWGRLKIYSKAGLIDSATGHTVGSSLIEARCLRCCRC